MKLSLWSAYFFEMSPEEVVEIFSRKGWRLGELSVEHSMRLMEQGDPAATAGDFLKFASDPGVCFPQGHLVFDDDIAGPHQDEVVEELTQWLDLYLALGITAAVVHPGGHELAAQDATPERILEAQVRSFTRLTDHVTGDGLVICLENVSGAGQSIEDLWGIIDACGSDHLGICLDTGHLNMAGGDQAAFIRKAGPRLKALHLCDNDASSDQHLMPYGSGTVRWDRVVAALGELRYDGLLNFELPGEVLCPIPVRLAKMDYLRNVAEIMFGGAAA